MESNNLMDVHIQTPTEAKLIQYCCGRISQSLIVHGTCINGSQYPIRVGAQPRL